MKGICILVVHLGSRNLLGLFQNVGLPLGDLGLAWTPQPLLKECKRDPEALKVVALATSLSRTLLPKILATGALPMTK
jgi:hypothetical protein